MTEISIPPNEYRIGYDLDVFVTRGIIACSAVILRTVIEDAAGFLHYGLNRREADKKYLEMYEELILGMDTDDSLELVIVSQKPDEVAGRLNKTLKLKVYPVQLGQNVFTVKYSIRKKTLLIEQWQGESF